jgi:tetratricopeptide (TPR) repeat protein
MATVNEYYQTWMDSQMNLVKSWGEAFQNPFIASNGNGKTKASSSTQATSDLPWTAMVENQMQMMKQWIDTSIKAMDSARELMSGNAAVDGSDVKTWYEQWMSSQTEMMQRWIESVRKTQTLATDYIQANTTTMNAMNQAFKLYDSWRAIATSWAAPSTSPFGKMMDVPKAYQEMVKNVFTAPNTYTKMLELWMPMFRAMQEYPMDVEKLREYFEPARYKEVLDRIFEFTSTKQMQQYLEHVRSFAQQFASSAQDSTKQLAQMMEKNAHAMAEMMMGNPESAMRLYNSMMSNYRKSFDIMLEATGARKDSELNHLASELVKRSTDYAIKVAHYQFGMYTTAQKAAEKMLATYTETAQKPEIFESYDAFFKAWASTNEEAFNHFVRSKEFVAMQKELNAAALEVRNTYQQLLELFLKDYPVVLRSEVEELQNTVQDLQTKLRSVADSGDEPKTSAKKATASKR